MSFCKCNANQECLDCYDWSLDQSHHESTYIEVLEIQSKLHLNDYFTYDIMREMKKHLKFTVSFNKTLVYCIDKVLRENDRYIPIQTLCYLNNLTFKDYKTFIKNHSTVFKESLCNLSIEAYAQYMCNHFYFSFPEKKIIVEKSIKFQEEQPTLHPLAIVCGHILVHFNNFKIHQMVEVAYVSAQSIQKVIKCLRK